jgi:hypothetical protein
VGSEKRGSERALEWLNTYIYISLTQAKGQRGEVRSPRGHLAVNAAKSSAGHHTKLAAQYQPGRWLTNAQQELN